MLHVIQADITTLKVDAIVNAANRSLLGGGGVDGAIHRAAGPQLLDACRKLNGCPVGQAKMTPAFDLPMHWIIHTVGPVWQGGQHNEAHQLASCYQACLTLAEQHDIHQLAFPCISTGVYGYPVQQAAEIAVYTVAQWLQDTHHDVEVIFCCFDATSVAIYQDLLAGLALAHADG
jgi:O-acetyl-ADP-ribose deacetylase (regulator of RNase III)